MNVGGVCVCACAEQLLEIALEDNAQYIPYYSIPTSTDSFNRMEL